MSSCGFCVSHEREQYFYLGKRKLGLTPYGDRIVSGRTLERCRGVRRVFHRALLDGYQQVTLLVTYALRGILGSRGTPHPCTRWSSGDLPARARFVFPGCLQPGPGPVPARSHHLRSASRPCPAPRGAGAEQHPARPAQPQLGQPPPDPIALCPCPESPRRRRWPMDPEAAGDELSRLRALFLACDASGSGRIEREDFAALCAELRVRPAEAEAIFQRLDSDRDGAITFPEFARGFRGATRPQRGGSEPGSEDMEEEEEASAAWVASGLEQPWKDFEVRLGDEARYIPR